MDFIIDNLSSIGLLIDIFGAVILWKYGLPATIDHKEFDAVMEHCLVVGKTADYDRTVSNSVTKIAEVKHWSRWGLGLLLAGFLLQGVGNLISNEKSNQSTVALEKIDVELAKLLINDDSTNITIKLTQSDVEVIKTRLINQLEKLELVTQGINTLNANIETTILKNTQDSEDIALLKSKIVHLNNWIKKFNESLAKSS